MGLLSFFNIRRGRPSSDGHRTVVDFYECIPNFWEADYCKVEIVPAGNLDFVTGQLAVMDRLAKKHRAEPGSREFYKRTSPPVLTLSLKLLPDSLESKILSYKLTKANWVRTDSDDVVDIKGVGAKAFGFPGFTIFFNTKDTFVNNIWIKVEGPVSDEQFHLVAAALYDLGEGSDLILVDWNSLEYVDLKDKNRITEYLRGYWR